MSDKKPFTAREQKVIDLLTEAHNAYCELQREEQFSHEEPRDFSFHMRALQARIAMRVMARDYPTEIKPA